MLTLKRVLGCLAGYFIAFFLFFTTEFVSYPQINSISNITLTQPIVHHNQKDQPNISQSKDPNFEPYQPIPQVSQVVLIIIDALRYDYINRMKLFNKTLTNHPQTTLIKKLIAGNPTMTTQRIESMMTGSQIFTQTNILQMFLSQKKSTDNLIAQLKRTGKAVKVFGDDTWVKLFDFQKEDAFVCDSTFNIRDYDSCDELVYRNLHRFVKLKEGLGKNDKEEATKTVETEMDSLLIGHFLAIDHIGHSTSSITSPEIDQKMQHMSLYLDHLMEIAADDTMFIITGDHGMREDGNHGGNSAVERESLMFAYYKPKEGEDTQNDFRERVQNFEGTAVSQVDLTATISVLLDVPIPVNSIGCAMIEILPQRYEPYLSRVLQNTLEQYKSLIDYYTHQGASNPNPNITAQCLTQITLTQQQLLNLDTKEQSFQQLMKIKQFIKQEIQLGPCLGEKLSMVEPDLLMVGVSLLLMAGFFVVLLGRDVLEQLRLVVEEKGGQRLLVLVLETLGWMGSLFLVYFSWYLIRNSSTHLLLLISIIIVTIPKDTLSSRHKVLLISLLLFLTQFESKKMNEYEQNYFNFRIMEMLIGIFNNLILDHEQKSSLKQVEVKQIKHVLHLLCLTMWAVAKLKARMFSVRTLKKNQARNNKRPLDADENTQCKLYVQIFLIVLVYLTLCIGQLAVSEASSIKIQHFVVWMRYVFVLSILGISLSGTQTDTELIVFLAFSTIVGLGNFLPLLTFVSCLSLVLTPSKQKRHSHKDQISPKPNHSHNMTLSCRIILVALIAEYMWWILGNRYEYSSIDISKSYILSVSFDLYLNAIGLVLWFVAPYLIAILYVDQRVYIKSQPLPEYKQVASEQEESLNMIDQEQRQAQAVLNYNSRLKDSLENKYFYRQSVVTFLYVFLSGLISAAVNLVLNNNQILFTIVYVPLLVLGILKVLTITLVIVLLLLHRK